MIGLDTNVLVRYLVQDEPHQARLATRLIESCNADNPGYVCLPVLIELVWVLGGAYGYARRDIAEVLQELLTVAELRIEQPDQARQALEAYAAGAADFADYLLGVLNAAQGCKTTYTFDKRAAKSNWHTLLA